MPEPTLVCDSNLDRDRWLEERRKGIGASDAPAILGLSPFASPLSIAASKQGLAPDPEDQESELQRWGRFVEAPMIAAFAEETGWEAETSGKLYRSTEPGREFMMVTLDGVCRATDGPHKGKIGGIECKLKIFGADEWEREGVPEHVRCQNQHGMGVMGWDFFVTLGLLDGYRLRWKTIDRNDELIGDVIVPAERDFWRRIQTGEPIPADLGPTDASARALKRLHPRDTGQTIRLAGPEWLKRLDDWNAAKAEAKAASEAADRHKLALVQAIGAATFAVLDDGRKLSLKTTDKAGYPVKPTTFRTLREVAGR